MAQHDYVIANANGATVRADINNALLAISSTNSGTSEPSTIYAFMLWVDTTTNLIKLRNAANDAWITLGVSVTASNTVDINGGAIDGTAIGASSATTGAFTTLTTTDNLSIGGSNKELRFYEGSNYVGFEAPALTGDQIWILPIEDGDADQVLATNGSGTLSFATASGTTINNNADNRVITGSGTANTLNGETNLTFDGSTLTVSGNVSVDSGTIKLDGNYPTGTSNIALGDTALDDGSLSGGYNSAVGSGALSACTSGSDNVAVGFDALKLNTTTSANTACGSEALRANIGNSNTAVGNEAMYGNTSGTLCTAVGALALDAVNTGESNTAIGAGAMTVNTSGAFNTSVGGASLAANSTASYNVATGYQALEQNSSGHSNVAIGVAAMNACSTGTHNVAVGRGSLDALTDSALNVGVGHNALGGLTTGDFNVGIGSDTGNYTVILTTGTRNICMGSYSHTSASGSINQHVFGYNVVGAGDSTFTFGYNQTDSSIAFGATSITAPSDVRLKEDIQDEKVGLDFINELRPVTFRWKKEKDISEELSAYKADSEERTMNGKYNHGFIAQEVKEVIDNNPDIKEGFDMWYEDDFDGRQRIGESALVPMLVKSIQELSAKVEDLENNKE